MIHLNKEINNPLNTYRINTVLKIRIDFTFFQNFLSINKNKLFLLFNKLETTNTIYDETKGFISNTNNIDNLKFKTKFA
jgi:hypothetical protein